MLTWSRALVAVSSAAAVVVVCAAAPVSADPFGHAGCDTRPRPGCEVTATDPGSTKPRQRADSGRSCRDRAGRQVPCHDRHAGDLAADGCYYRPADVDAATEARMGGRPDGPGAWYWRTCLGELDGNATSRVLVWLPAPPVASAEVFARHAASRLDLPVPRIGSNPDVRKLVRLPVWLWLPRSSWAPRSATARVPGLSVTATARPVAAVWRMGDGSNVPCRGPGTRWRPGIDPRAESPDCGYTYRSSSAGRPGGVYRVVVTVTWAVSWSTGRRSGTLPPLSTTAVARFQVAESQALITR